MDKPVQLRGYSIVEVKAVQDEQRTIEGWATTPKPDRVRDVIVAEGVKSLADIPLFMHHDSRRVVGRTQLGAATRKGVPFKSALPFVAEAGRLRDEIEYAWQSVKYRLITGVSVGFRPLWEKAEQLADGGWKFNECEVVELSLVPVPMNAEAVITQFRSMDAARSNAARSALLQIIKSEGNRAALGALPVVRLDRTAPAASGNGMPGASGQQGRRAGVVYLNRT